MPSAPPLAPFALALLLAAPAAFADEAPPPPGASGPTESATPAAPAAAPAVENSTPATPAPEPAVAPTPSAPTPSAPTPTTPPPAPPDAWQQYADAAELGAGNNVREADALLDALQKAQPEHPAAARATKLRELFVPRLKAATTLPAVPRRPIDPSNPASWLRPESAEPLSRAELAVVQTIHGVVVGIEFCGILNNCSAQLTATALIVGGAVGLGTSLLLTSDGITAGHTLALDSGTLWGAWHGLAFNFILSAQSSGQQFGVPLAGQAIGLGAGHLVWTFLQPAVGDVSLANSGGIWTGVLATLLIGASGATLGSAQFFSTVLAASDVGLILGAIASSYFPMSRGRTLILDAGAGLGILLGAALGVIGSVPMQTQFALMSAGLVVGAAGAFWLTRSWDKPPADLAPAISIVPTERGGAMAVLGWRL